MSNHDHVRLLIIDDADDDAVLLTEELVRDGMDVVSTRVDERVALQQTLRHDDWDIVISDYAMPRLAAEEALSIVREIRPDLPFLVVSGAVGEQTAVDLMRGGAVDYVTKSNLSRLAVAVRRELREAEIRRQNSEAAVLLTGLREQLQATVESAPVGIVNVTPDGRFLQPNKRFCELIGYTCEEVLGLRLSDITVADDLPAGAEGIARMERAEIAEYRVEQRYRRKDGGIVWVSMSSAPVRDAAGTIRFFATVLLDITDKKGMESALRESHQRYRDIVETSQEGIWTTDANDRTTFVNKRMAELLGYSVEEMIGRSIDDFVDEPHRQTAHDYAAGSIGAVGAIVLRRSDSGPVWVQSSTSPLYGAGGVRNGSITMFTDITDRHHAEEEMRRQKLQLEDAQRIAHIGSWRRDLSSENLEWSDELYRLYGLTPGRIQPTVGLVVDSVVPEDRESLQRIIAEAVKSGRGLDVQYQIRRPDGSHRFLHTRAEFIRGEDGPGQLVGTTQDITDRVEATFSRERLTRNLELLLESTTQGIYGIDPDGRCTFVNRAAADALGYAPAELIGKAMHDLIHHSRADGHPHPAADCPIQSSVRDGVACDVQHDTLWKSDGSSLPVDFSSAPIFDRGEVVGAVVVFSDVSERQLLEAQLQQAERLSSLGRVAATVAHEFNNVLMGIQPFAEALVRQGSDDLVHGPATQILHAVQRGRRVTEEILRFTRPAEPVKEVFDAGAWLRSLERSVAAILGDDIRLHVEIHGDSLLVRGDRHQLEQVMTNLAANARDAMRSGGTLTIRAGTGVSGTVFPFGRIPTVDMYLHLKVADTGTGMDEETVRKIFDPFFTTKRTGTGLGLPVVHKILELHGGSIFADSVPGKGTAFHLFLPLAEETNLPAPRREVPRAPARATPGVAYVLLVEDDAGVASGLAALFDAEGIEITVATTGGDAIESVSRRVPDVVVLDIGLPDIDGREVYRRIVTIEPDLPVIFASGSHDEPLLRPYLSRDRVRSLMKPYDFDSLLGLIATVTSRR